MEMQQRCLDDGYVSGDNAQHLNLKQEEQYIDMKLIAKEAKEFRAKYITQKVLNNSANGVIYQGKSSQTI